MQPEFSVTVAAGTLSDKDRVSVHFDHRWTTGGVTLQAEFTGAHLLHAAVAGCVLNDVFREAERLDLPVDGVRVRADGGFTSDWQSIGIEYEVEVDTSADPPDVERLLAAVDDAAEIPRALRAGVPVKRVSEP